jgi:hypothetical protein
MKKLVLLLLASMMVIASIGCDGDNTVNSSAAVPNNEFNKSATVQGTVYDALTGDRIGSDDLSITMVRGTGYYSPDMLYTSANVPTSRSAASDSRLGDFVFGGVPVTLGCSATYRVMASADGYQPFNGYLRLHARLKDGVGSSTVDQIYNFIKNIYLFPVGTNVPDYTFHFEYNLKPVAGVTVRLEYDASDYNDATVCTPYPLYPTDLTAATMYTTDDNGDVDIMGADLVLGGRYTISAAPTTVDGVPVTMNGTRSFTAGVSDVDQAIQLRDLVPGANLSGLYIVSRSNHDQYAPVASGELSVTFNQAVTLVDEASCSATLYGSLDGGAIDNTDPPDSTVDVTGSGTTTLTFTPNLATPLGADAINVEVRYGGSCYVTIGVDTARAYNIFSDGIFDNQGHTLYPYVAMTGTSD